MERHEFLTLKSSVYDGLRHTEGKWYCACGKWQSKGRSPQDQSNNTRKAQQEFLEHPLIAVIVRTNVALKIT